MPAQDAAWPAVGKRVLGCTASRAAEVAHFTLRGMAELADAADVKPVREYDSRRHASTRAENHTGSGRWVTARGGGCLLQFTDRTRTVAALARRSADAIHASPTRSSARLACRASRDGGHAWSFNRAAHVLEGP